MAALDDPSCAPERKGPYLGVFGHARVEDRRANMTARSAAVRIHRSPDRVLASREHGRTETHADWRAAESGRRTPWSRLKGGALSGKYTRAKRRRGGGWKRDRWARSSSNRVSTKRPTARRGARRHRQGDTTSTVARVALAMGQGATTGGTSTIIGALRLAQLGDNMSRSTSTSPSEELRSPRRAHEAERSLPQNLQAFFQPSHSGGTKP